MTNKFTRTGDAAELRQAADVGVMRVAGQLHAILQTAMDGFWQTTAQGRLLAVNDAYCRMSGYSEAELLAMSVPDLVVTESAEGVASRIRKITAQGQDRFESRHRRKDGTLFDVEASVLFLPDLGGQVVAFLRDITERKRAEAAMRQSEVRLREILENSHDAAYKRNLQTNTYDYLSPAFTRIAGYTPDEMKNLPAETVLSLMHPEDLAEVERTMGASMAGETGKTYELTYRFRHKEGQYRWLQDRFVFVRDEKGQPLALIGSVGDITDRKRAEEALQESQGRFRELAETICDVFWSATPNGQQMLYISPAYAEIWGRSPETLYTSPTDWLTAIELVDQPAVLAAVERLAKGEPYDLEYRIHRPDGSTRWIRDRGFPVRDAGGIVCRTVGAASDITERKQAEEGRTRSHELLANLARLVPGVVYQYRLYPDGRSAFPYSSPGMYGIYEVMPEEVREDATPVFGRLHPDDHDRVAVTIQESARTLREFYCEFRVILPSQGLRWRWAQAHPERMDDGGTLWHGIIMDITERKLAEAAMRESEEKYRVLVETTNTGFLILSNEGRVIDANAEYVRLTGHRELDDIRGKAVIEWTADYDRQRNAAAVAQCVKVGFVRDLVIDYVGGNGRITPVEVNATIIGTGKSMRVVSLCRDVTERKREEVERGKLQAQLAQAQKLESVGRLAGGVAHDFNNLLMGIMNYVELCRDEVPPEHSVRGYLDEITRDAQRSADITKQLLAFARKQVITPKVLDLNDALVGMLKMLRHLMGEGIAVNWMPGTHLWPVKIDPGQLDQILANLCVNARDAIAGVGKVAIETATVTLDAAYCAQHVGAAPGEYVRLAVSDSGCGMSKNVIAYIFEPFYTTKEVGKGTGLGLATVYGIVEQNHGHIEVQSAVGKGTTFSIYLPRAASEADTGPVAVTPEKLPRGTETILVAEDEKSVRVTSRQFLKQLGYTVMVAETPDEALRLGGTHAGPIHLLITDVIMPGMNGPDLAGLLAAKHPKLKCLFMSGYTADVMTQRGALGADVPFLAKPFSRHDLARKVREVLDGR
jgi:PAS domain S-box-containing protein